jgi:flagellar M-ring protein FliF
MAPESVVVSDLTTGFTYPATKPGQPGAGMQDPYTITKVTHERNWTEKIRNALSYIPGVIVTCNVDLNKELEQEQQKTQFDPKPVAVATEEESKTLSSQAPQPAGPPGLAAQNGIQPNQPAVARAGTGGASSDEEISKSAVRSVTSQDVQLTKLAGLTPDRVTASIAVPSSYLEQVWSSRNKPQPGQQPKAPQSIDLKSIEEEVVQDVQLAVAQIVPLRDEAAFDPIKQVRVTVFDSLPQDEIAEPGISDHALAWLGAHWSTLGTGLLGLVSLVMLRSMVRAAPAAEALPTPLAADDEENVTLESSAPGESKPASTKSNAASRLKRREKGGPSLREELVEIVREDPDAAANVLRGWINSGTA